jgi:CRISPR/Cas system CSM-associated protein Csm3 (group 7 of RAMP superfamily)
MRPVGLIRIDIVLDSPGGVTAPEIGAVIDLPLRKGRHDTASSVGTASGPNIWIPPSSLAGSLRAHFAGRAEQFFGSPAPAGRGGDARLQPSPVRFLGTMTALPSQRNVEQRSSTAVDPIRGAAVPATLHTRELLPAGTTITLYLRYDDRGFVRTLPEPLPFPTYALEEFAELAATWRPQIGRGRSSGHGLAHVHRVAYRTFDLGVAADLKSWLMAGREELFPDSDDAWHRIIRPAKPTPTVLLELGFIGVDALHIGSGSRTDGAAGIQTSGGRPIIPAGSWKGLLRSRCGFILRSCGQPACLVPGHAAGVLERACRACRLCALFGWTGDGGTNNEAIGWLGDLMFHDSRITGHTGRRNHIGIDRFTGGVRRQLLFADEVVTDARFTLRITTTRPGSELSAADRGLLLLAIRDLHDGLIGLGRSSTRGYGTVRLTEDSQASLAELRPSHETGAAVLNLLRGAA